jgi:hypothetical protein
MKKIKLKFIKFIVLMLFLSIDVAFAHKSETHDPETHMDPVECIPESERTSGQLKWDISVNKNFHRLSKRQMDCAIDEIKKLKAGKSELEALITQIEAKKNELQNQLANAAICADVNFNHKSSNQAILFAEPNSKSRKVADIKSGTNLLYISDSASKKKWSFVLLKNEDRCSPGYIQKEFIAKKSEVVEQAPKEVKADLISITNPTWAKKEKLIIVSASGFVTIKGFVDTNKIDQIIVNEKERQINNDDTFSFNIRVKDAGTEVRIVGNKQGDTKKTMTFLIKAE